MAQMIESLDTTSPFVLIVILVKSADVFNKLSSNLAESVSRYLSKVIASLWLNVHYSAFNNHIMLCLFLHRSIIDIVRVTSSFTEETFDDI